MGYPAYTPTDWRDFPDTSTAMTRAALRAMENQLAAYALSLVTTLPEARNVGADTTLLLADLGGVVRIGSTSNRVFTIPPFTGAGSVAVPMNSFMYLFQSNTGLITVQHALGSAHLYSPKGFHSTADRYGKLLLWKWGGPAGTDNDAWTIDGNLGPDP